MIRDEPDANTPNEPAIRLSATLKRRIASGLKLISIGYLVTLVIALILVRWIGERSIPTSILLLAPAQMWLLPVFLIGPLILVFQRKLLWVPVAAILFVFFGYMNFRASFPASSEGKTLKILSNNIGQRKTRTMWPFLHAQRPDVFALQEAWGHRPAISSENPDYYVGTQGEFLLASRFEIVDSGTLSNIVAQSGAPVAAWFEIDFHGTPVVIYNVHMPTPRNDFNKLRGAGFLFELGRRGGIYSGKGREAYRQATRHRIQLSADLLEHLRKETRPFIVVGDFNMTDLGYIYRLYSRELSDAFAARGNGYGHTLPGFTRNPLTLFGPWLRIDYIFAGKHWKPISCAVEPRQPAQHLSVAAELEFSQTK